MPFSEPLGVYTALSVFGEPVQIGGKTVNAIFDRAYVPDTGFGLLAANADPQLIVADADLPPDAADAPVVVRGRTYRVASIEFDGTGMSTVQLRADHDPPAY